jgi:hypothetical protein
MYGVSLCNPYCPPKVQAPPTPILVAPPPLRKSMDRRGPIYVTLLQVEGLHKWSPPPPNGVLVPEAQ